MRRLPAISIPRTFRHLGRKCWLEHCGRAPLPRYPAQEGARRPVCIRRSNRASSQFRLTAICRSKVFTCIGTKVAGILYVLVGVAFSFPSSIVRWPSLARGEGKFRSQWRRSIGIKTRFPEAVRKKKRLCSKQSKFGMAVRGGGAWLEMGSRLAEDGNAHGSAAGSGAINGCQSSQSCRQELCPAPGLSRPERLARRENICFNSARPSDQPTILAPTSHQGKLNGLIIVAGDERGQGRTTIGFSSSNSGVM